MIERLIKRLLKGITNLSVVKNLSAIISGFAIEFYRFIDYKNEVLSSVIPNESMSVDSIGDYNAMFGIPLGIGGTNNEQIARIIEKSDITGFPGRDWFEGQVRQAGYDLYVIEQSIQPAEALQWGDFQFEDSAIQFGLTARFLDPANVPGILIVNQPYSGSGRIYVHQYGPGILDVFSSMYGNIQYGSDEYGTIGNTVINQYGTDGVQYGEPDLNSSYPIAMEYNSSNSAPARFGFYFFLSPFPDRLALDSELLELSADEYSYLRSLVIGSKLVRNYCIAQVEVI